MVTRVVVLGLFLVGQIVADHETVSSVNTDKFSVAKDKRYLIYDTNRGEGFNLRRDVYMRLANTVRLLREAGENFVLVLPPWGGLYHWERQETKMPWSTYFDKASLNEFVPVMEFEEFLEENPSQLINQVVYLQHYKEGWDKEYVLKYDKRDCMDGHKYYRKEGELWMGWFFSYYDVRATNFECVSVQGDSETLKRLIIGEYPDVRSIFVDRGETILHKNYGEKHYWEARRSMRYAKHLIETANMFRSEKLDSEDEKDNTVLPDSWREDGPKRNAKGGDYLCAHWRRKDFVSAHGKELPSIEGTARLDKNMSVVNLSIEMKYTTYRSALSPRPNQTWYSFLNSCGYVVKVVIACLQLNQLENTVGVSAVYLATDARENEVRQLGELVKLPVLRYTEKTLSDGEIAIVDQIICSHAKYFIGSHVSTFSFRIQEDREILGFRPETTFNRMCPDTKTTCEQPAKWKIVY